MISMKIADKRYSLRVAPSALDLDLSPVLSRESQAAPVERMIQSILSVPNAQNELGQIARDASFPRIRRS
jgi:hypothetical protein